MLHVRELPKVKVLGMVVLVRKLRKRRLHSLLPWVANAVDTACHMTSYSNGCRLFRIARSRKSLES